MPIRLHVPALALFALIGCHATTAAAPTPAAEAPAGAVIRELRARSNTAIAARDARAVAAMMVDDIVVTGGNGGPLLMGRERAEASFAAQFADTSFIGYVRTPSRVDVGTTRPVAAEAGQWVGRWRAADGIRELRGTYLAMWRRDDGAWRLRSELYVTLACSGSATCPRTR
jgi:ketosteroid isomerase-like protein